MCILLCSIAYNFWLVVILAQIIWSTRRLVKVLLGIQQKFYQTSKRAIYLLLDIQQIFTPSKRCLVDSYFSATRCLVQNPLIDVQQSRRFGPLSGEKHDLYVQSSAVSFTEIIGLFLSMCNLSLTSLAPHSLLVL